MKKLLLSFAAALMGIAAMAGDYEIVSSEAGINTTDTYVLTYMADPAKGVTAVMGDIASGKTFLSSITEGFESTATELTTTTATPVEFTFVAGTAADTYAIKSAAGKYLAMTTASNGKLAWKDELAEISNLKITYTDGVLKIVFSKYTSKNELMYNANSGQERFANYGGTQKACTLFKAQTGVSKLPAGLSFPEASYSVKFGQEFTAPELTKATNAAITYTSSVPEVATVAEDGAVTIVGIGTTEIKATAAETDTYKGGTASYTLAVIDPDTFWAPDCKDKTNSEFTFEILEGEFQPWSVDDRYGLKASAFASSKANASDAVAASPVLDFTNFIAPMTLNYRQALHQFKINNVLIECTDEAIAPYLSVVAKEDGTDVWVKIGAVNAPAKGFSWDFYDGTEIDLAQFAGKKVQIGFHYVSTTECAGTWEVDNVVVKARAKASAVDTVITDNTDAPVEYYNLQGIRVANPENGIYIRRQGNKVTKVLVK